MGKVERPKVIEDGRKFMFEGLSPEERAAYIEWEQHWIRLNESIVATGIMDQKSADRLIFEISYSIPYHEIPFVLNQVQKGIKNKTTVVFNLLESWSNYKRLFSKKHEELHRKICVLRREDIPKEHLKLIETLETAKELPEELKQYQAATLFHALMEERLLQVHHAFDWFLDHLIQIKRIREARISGKITADYPPEVPEGYTPQKLSEWYLTAWGEKVSPAIIREHHRCVQKKRDRGNNLCTKPQVKQEAKPKAKKILKPRIEMSGIVLRLVVDSIYTNGHIGKKYPKPKAKN